MAPRRRIGYRAGAKGRHSNRTAQMQTRSHRPLPAPALIAVLTIALAAPLAVMDGAAAQDTPAAFRLGGLEFLGGGPDHLQVGAGLFNVIPTDDLEEGVRNSNVLGEARLEYRFGEKLWSVGPMLGFLLNSKGGLFGYGALYTDIRYGDWVITPSGGLGGYRQGAGKDLGGTFQFHLGLDVAYQLETGRVGLKLSHISNATIHADNPGVESLLLTYSVPFDPF